MSEAGRNCVYSPYYILLPEKLYKILYLESYTFACKEHIKRHLGVGGGVFLYFFLSFKKVLFCLWNKEIQVS